MRPLLTSLRLANPGPLALAVAGVALAVIAPVLADPFAHGTPAGDHHSWVRVQSPACPDCRCCTALLCRTARERGTACEWVCSAEAFQTVRGCPCTAPAAVGAA